MERPALGEWIAVRDGCHHWYGRRFVELWKNLPIGGVWRRQVNTLDCKELTFTQRILTLP
jgi:hypothetical protein